jgi:hypothetical protein
MCAQLLVLLVLACLAGLIVGWFSGAPRGTLLRLLNKPKKAPPPPVLVPPGPTPRLVPADSPKATRARSIAAPGTRQTPPGIKRSGPIDYIAVFGDPVEGNEATRVDYLLDPGDEEDEATDPSHTP